VRVCARVCVCVMGILCVCRQFCNKLWNAVRFGLTYLSDFVPTPTMHLEIVGNPSASARSVYCAVECVSNVCVCVYMRGVCAFKHVEREK
jgi:hypothetical protein